MINLKLTTENHLDHLKRIKEHAYGELSEDYKDLTDLSWHVNMRTEGLYFSIFYDDILIGGINLQSDRKSKFYINSLFIDPGLHRRGFGREVINQIEQKYHEWQSFSIEIPTFLDDSIPFFKSCGYCVTDVLNSQGIKITTLKKIKK